MKNSSIFFKAALLTAACAFIFQTPPAFCQQDGQPAADNGGTVEAAPQAFGVKNGAPIANYSSVISELDSARGTPVIEVLLSEAVLSAGKAISGNPGGHISVAVNGTTYTVSEGYYDKTKKICALLPVVDYLYGTTPPDGFHVFASSYGSCYGRSVWGVRVYKLPANIRPELIPAYWTKANAESVTGDPKWEYKKRKQNCATFTAASLHAAGFKNYLSGYHLLDFPRDIVTDFIKELSNLPSDQVAWEVVHYQQIPVKGYGTSFSVPNLEWQRIILSLPLLRKMAGIPTIKGNTDIELVAEGIPAVVKIRPFERESWLKKLARRISREKWSHGRTNAAPATTPAGN
ncbi:MAG TPA: hypothetical protein DC017_11945 [Candidatus Wallbacteria bacterium]|nr:hypothetical protein [Candidatus Wallbacteria bacterium]